MLVQTDRQSRTFAVQAVEPGTERLETYKTQEAVSDRLGKRVEACSDYTADCIKDIYFHPLFGAVHHAHINHYPLILSPDMIWIAILQGLAQHVKNNAERLRPKLVSHEGQKSLHVIHQEIHPGSPENPWAEVIRGFTHLLGQDLGALHQNLLPNFSTTGYVERTVAEIALLDTFQPYYQYESYAGCGIPEITLEGTEEDWDQLHDQIQVLDQFELNWWTPHLRKIVNQFRQAARGNVNRVFWGNIYKHESYYGSNTINGWLTLLVPYLMNRQTGRYTRPNDVFTYQLDWENGEPPSEPLQKKDPFRTMPRVFPSQKYMGISTDSLPSGLSQAPFRLTWGRHPHASEQSMEFIGGFFGATQDPQTLAIRPKLGWAVAQGSEHADTLDRLRKFKTHPPLDAEPLATVINQWSETTLTSSLPGELLLLYHTFNGFSLPNGWKIRPISQVEIVPPPDRKPVEIRWSEGQRSDGPAFRFADLPDGSTLAIDADETWFKVEPGRRFRVFRFPADAQVVTGDEEFFDWGLFNALKTILVELELDH